MRADTESALTTALRTVRLEATVYFHADLAGPWGMSIRAGQFANFHILTDGECVVSGGGPSVRLRAGDLVVFPTGVPHALAGCEDAALTPAEQMLPAIQESGSYGSGTPCSRLICGHFDLLRDRRHPLFHGLPERIVLRAQGGWVRTATELAAAESARGGPGSGAIVDRLAEALLIEVLRRHTANGPTGVGSLAGLAHPGLSRSLAAIHADPAHPWTLDQLARRAGMSRTRFADSFRQIIGEPPLTYLTHWRLATAAGMLAEDHSLEQVAENIGYANAFSFSKAFKRQYGVPPSEWRRRAAG